MPQTQNLVRLHESTDARREHRFALAQLLDRDADRELTFGHIAIAERLACLAGEMREVAP